MKNEQQHFIAGLRNGDAACYETLVRKFGGRMLAVAMRYLRNEADAGECVQEAYLQAFRSIDRFEERASVESWLHRIVVNTALMKLRAQKRRPEEPYDNELTAFDSNGQRVERELQKTASVEELLTRAQTCASVQLAIDTLPEKSRNLILLRDIEGYNTLEAAELLGISPGAAKTGLHRARNSLKKRLTPMMREDEK